MDKLQVVNFIQKWHTIVEWAS